MSPLRWRIEPRPDAARQALSSDSSCRRWKPKGVRCWCASTDLCAICRRQRAPGTARASRPEPPGRSGPCRFLREADAAGARGRFMPAAARARMRTCRVRRGGVDPSLKRWASPAPVGRSLASHPRVRARGDILQRIFCQNSHCQKFLCRLPCPPFRAPAGGG